MNEKAYAIEVTYPDGITRRVTYGSAGHEYRGTRRDAGELVCEMRERARLMHSGLRFEVVPVGEV